MGLLLELEYAYVERTFLLVADLSWGLANRKD